MAFNMFKKLEATPGDHGGGGVNKESMEERNKRIHRLIVALARYVPGGRLEEFMEEIDTFAKKLRAKYSNFHRYHLFHMLMGSTIEPKYDIEEDFPGEDSVEKFLHYLYEKYVTRERGPSTLDIVSVD